MNWSPYTTQFSSSLKLLPLHTVYPLTDPCWLCSLPAASQGKDTGLQIGIPTAQAPVRSLHSNSISRLPPAAGSEAPLKQQKSHQQVLFYILSDSWNCHAGRGKLPAMLMFTWEWTMKLCCSCCTTHHSCRGKVCQIHQEQTHMLELVTALSLPEVLSRFGGMSQWGIHLWTSMFLQQTQVRSSISPS